MKDFSEFAKDTAKLFLYKFSYSPGVCHYYIGNMAFIVVSVRFGLPVHSRILRGWDSCVQH